MRWFCFIFFAVFCHADFADHLKKDLKGKEEKSSIEGIDFIYLINLDKRIEKLEKCLLQLHSYEIFPYRFSAIDGWALPPEAFDDLGVRLSPNGKTYFSCWMAPGCIGCTLSHLSVLQDAYDSGYQTIWVMEDDISVRKDPHLLTGLIHQLDTLVGEGGWDIFYTDNDLLDKPMYPEGNDFQSDLKGDLYYFKRPDMDLSDQTPFAKRTILSKDFLKIGSRMRTHSMVIRRSGMEKILNFEKKHHIFIPYDHELAIVPDIKMVSLRTNLVTHSPSVSDTRIKN